MVEWLNHFRHLAPPRPPARRLLEISPMTTDATTTDATTGPVDLVVVFSPVGGGHKAAAMAVAEAARARGLRVAVLDAFDDAPPLFGDAYVAAHLTGQNVVPDLYGSAYFAADRR